MDTSMQDIVAYLDENRARFERELMELLSIASVSADSRHKPDVDRAAAWVASHLENLGLHSRVIATEGHPLVYAESTPVEGRPVVLVYGHYDVQPPDPLDQWISPPFEPTVRDGNVYARGATDDKGQMFTHIKSVEAWLRVYQRLPLQIKFLIEGEEEVGSVSLERYLEQNAEQLRCHTIVISDSAQWGPGQPAITYGLRGIAYFELRIRGPKQDLHSGTFGGSVVNPVNALTRILSGLMDRQGRVDIPGFYDDVLPLTDEERRQWETLGFDEERYRQQLDVPALGGEQGYSTLERCWARPTYDINGIWGGYQGQGSKTVLPAQAGAKFSFRLVPNQNPQRIAEALRQRIAELCPPGVRWELITMHGGAPYIAPLNSPYMAAAQRAITAGFGRAPVLIREGGSIPIVTAFRQHLGVDSLLLGWGQHDDNTHSPNEKFSLSDFHRGIRASAFLWNELSQCVPNS
jgi:acetylornithine deacetylase/succinyl-diaminopimelate desuccinylase-like protein